MKITRTLKHGWKIGSEVHMDFEMRESVTADVFKAEEMADARKPITFDGALIAVQITRIGSYTGPVTLEMVGSVKPADFTILRKALEEVDAGGA